MAQKTTWVESPRRDDYLEKFIISLLRNFVKKLCAVYYRTCVSAFLSIVIIMLPPWSAVDRNQLRKDGITLFSRLIRTKNVENYQDKSVTVPRAHDRKHKLMVSLHNICYTCCNVC